MPDDPIARTSLTVRRLTGAILTGRGRQPGAPKEAASVPLLDRLLAPLRACCESIVVIADAQCPPCRERGLAVYPPDKLLGRSALGMVYTALRAAPTEYVFVCGGAMPLMNEPLIRYLATFAEGTDAVVPCSADGPQPMHAIYSRRLIPVLERQLGAGLRQIEDLISAIDPWIVSSDEVAAIDPSGVSLRGAAIPSDAC